MNTPTNESPQAGGKASVAKATDTAKKVGSAARQHSQRAFETGVSWAEGLSRPALAWGGIAFAAILLLASNLLVGNWFKSWRADLTQDGLYTISGSTRKVLSAIDEPINVKVYYTKALGEMAPVYGTYFERVRSLLERYRDLSRGKLQVQFINPLAFSDAEDRAVGSGLRGIRLNQEGDQAYFGLVATNTTDNSETIGFFSPDRERFLEYLKLPRQVHYIAPRWHEQLQNTGTTWCDLNASFAEAKLTFPPIGTDESLVRDYFLALFPALAGHAAGGARRVDVAHHGSRGHTAQREADERGDPSSPPLPPHLVLAHVCPPGRSRAGTAHGTDREGVR